MHMQGMFMGGWIQIFLILIEGGLLEVFLSGIVFSLTLDYVLTICLHNPVCGI